MIKAELRVLTGRHAGKAISLPAKKFLIGRGEDCHLRPNSDLISRHHCVFTVDEYGVQLRDLGSTNGTFVNDEQLKGVKVLESRDQVRVGKLEFELLLHEVEQQVEENTRQGSDETVVSSMDDTSHQMPEYDPNTMLESQTSTDSWSQTDPTATTDLHNIPADAFNQGQPGMSDTQADSQAFQYPPQQPMQGYPMQQPPGYPMPPQYPPGAPAYPQAPYQQYPPAAYPPAQYPMQGYPQYPPQGAPMAPPPSGEIPAVNAEQPAEGEAKSGKDFKAAIPLKLPNPEETGFKEEPKPEAAEKKATSGEAPAEEPEKPSNKAADIINQYRNRRPG